MAGEPLYDFTDPEGVDRIVRTIPGTEGIGGPGNNFKVPVVDEQDVDSGQHFREVPFAALGQRDSG